MKNQLTLPALRELILKVMNEASLDTLNEFSDELLQEPTEDLEDPPEAITESIDNKLIQLLNRLPVDRRKAIFGRFGFHTQNALLNNINKVQKASKGSL
tara:strand:- start:650 stop:946 length:297 start_codon:yes stop_codon:yes gene_type:complete